jgi:hypothetical protein
MSKKYSVIVRGENFVLNNDGVEEVFGFVTTRNVKASSIEDAKKSAISLVECDTDLRALMSQKQSDINPPTLFVEEMYELSWWKVLGGNGFTFFKQ